MANTTLGDGTTVQIDDGAASAYVAIPGVISLTPPATKIGSYDATALTSTAGTMVLLPKSRAEPGGITLKMFYKASEYIRLEALKGVLHNLKITYPDAQVTTAPGWIESVEKQEVQNQDPVEMTVNWINSTVPTTV